MVYPKKYEEKGVTCSVRIPEYIREQIIKEYETITQWVDLKIKNDKKIKTKQVEKKDGRVYK